MKFSDALQRMKEGQVATLEINRTIWRLIEKDGKLSLQNDSTRNQEMKLRESHILNGNWQADSVSRT